MARQIIPPLRSQPLAGPNGLGTTRTMEYLELTAEQVNDSTSANEADPATVNLSAASISSMKKRIDELENQMIERIDSAVRKRLAALESASHTEQRGRYSQLKIDRATVKTLTASGTITGPSGSWSSTGLDLAVGDAYQINAITVLNATTLGAGVIASSLTSVGTLTSLTVSGTITGPSGSWSSTGFNLAVSDVYSINSTQVVGARGAAVADAAGGATIDAEARTAINALLAELRAATGHGLIA